MPIKDSITKIAKTVSGGAVNVARSVGEVSVNVAKSVGEGASTVAKKSGEMLERSKLAMSIPANEEKIKELTEGLGVLIYERYKNNEEIPDYLIESCIKIDELHGEISAIRDRLKELKNVKICPVCESEIDADAEFCSKCGVKLDTIEGSEISGVKFEVNDPTMARFIPDASNETETMAETTIKD